MPAGPNKTRGVILRQFIPILEWLPHYRKALLRGDVLAGLTVGVMLIPQGMAYGLLAGLDPIHGLYASILPLFIYAFFGTSRQLSVGPVALVSLLILAGVGQFAEPGTTLFFQLAVTTALIAGLIQVLLGSFRLGFLINFLSHPVIAGFTSAAAFIIGMSQLKNLLRINIGRSNYIHEIVADTAQHITEMHWPTLVIGVGGIAFMLILKRIKKSLPGALLAVILGTVIVFWWRLDLQGVETVGQVPKGLPAFQLPIFSGKIVLELLPLALTICLISFIESLAIAKTIEARHKNYRVIPNQELIALGITKIGGAFFQSYPTTGSFTRSAVNDDSGANTGFSSMISAVLVALTLLFLTPLFYYLPKAILASIIVVAVINLVDYKEAIHLWRTDRRDLLTMLVTFVATLTMGIQNGVFAGIILSLAIMVYRNSRPHIALLGKLPGSPHYRNIGRFNEAQPPEEVLIMRFDAQLYFGNATYFRETIEEMVGKAGTKLRLFILDASGTHDIDSSGVHVFHEVLDYLKQRGVAFYLSGAIGPVRDILFKNGLMDIIGERHQFLSVADAVEYFQKKAEAEAEAEAMTPWTPKALQTNAKKPPE